jgi:hypothetical protein
VQERRTGAQALVLETLVDDAIAQFNAGQYRAALLAFEQLWHAERSDLLRALILISNALHQLRLGLVTAPRRNLASAAALLNTIAPDAAELDLGTLAAQVEQVRQAIPAGLESGSGHLDWDSLPRPGLQRR